MIKIILKLIIIILIFVKILLLVIINFQIRDNYKPKNRIPSYILFECYGGLIQVNKNNL